MLTLSRQAAPLVAEAIGNGNVRFVEGAIEALDEQGDSAGPLVPDASIDVVLSNCVLNLVNPLSRQRLLANIRRVLAPGDRVAISDIVCDQPVPMHLQQDPELWSGCISGAWQEDDFLKDFRALGLEQVTFADRSEQPWRTLEGIEFRAVTLVGHGVIEARAATAEASSRRSSRSASLTPSPDQSATFTLGSRKNSFTSSPASLMAPRRTYSWNEDKFLLGADEP